MSDIIYCPHCGAKNEAGANYCCRCGKSIYDRNYAETQVYEPAPKKKTAMIIIIVLVAAALAIAATLVWVHFFKPVKVDLTANITKDSIVLSGHNGKGKAVIDNEKLRSLADYDRGNKRAVNFMKSVNYSLDKNTNLSNGDTVTLTANWSHATANSMHVSINDISKEIKISGLTKKNTNKEGTNYNYDTSYKTSDYFILPNSDTEYVTEQDLDGLSACKDRRRCSFANDTFRRSGCAHRI